MYGKHLVYKIATRYLHEMMQYLEMRHVNIGIQKTPVTHRPNGLGTNKHSSTELTDSRTACELEITHKQRHRFRETKSYHIRKRKLNHS